MRPGRAYLVLNLFLCYAARKIWETCRRAKEQYKNKGRQAYNFYYNHRISIRDGAHLQWQSVEALLWCGCEQLVSALLDERGCLQEAGDFLQMCLQRAHSSPLLTHTCHPQKRSRHSLRVCA
jgi:hypothetical protein